MNCYNRIVHLFASLSNQHFRVQLEYLLVLFMIIQSIKMFLRTSYRVLKLYYTSSKNKLFQGAIQGNGAAPLMWLIILIFLVRYLYKLKQIHIRYSPISKVAYQIAEFLYVDDTDLVTLNKGDESVSEVVSRA